MFRSLTLSLLLLLAAAAPLRSETKEYLIVSGGVSLMQWEKYKAEPHDRWWLNFIRAAGIRIGQLRQEQGPGAMITWMVYQPAYQRRMREEPVDMLSVIRGVRDAYGVDLRFYSSSREVVNHINSGRPRDSVKIALFEFFGHSNKACFMFDYSNEIDSASKQWLHENELAQIRRASFARGALAKSWGCHTGESMSKKWRAATGIPMIGAVGKTQYQTHELPTLSSPVGRWAQ